MHNHLTIYNKLSHTIKFTFLMDSLKKISRHSECQGVVFKVFCQSVLFFFIIKHRKRAINFLIWALGCVYSKFLFLSNKLKLYFKNI